MKNNNHETVKRPLVRFHRPAVITQQLCQLQHCSFPPQMGARPNQEAGILEWSCSSSRDAEQNHQEQTLQSLPNQNERSLTGRRERQEACVALEFQGSKNKMGAWIPRTVDGERWWQAQQHASSHQNYSWAADPEPDPDHQHNRHRKRFPSSHDLKLALELHKASLDWPLVVFA